MRERDIKVGAKRNKEKKSPRIWPPKADRDTVGESGLHRVVEGRCSRPGTSKGSRGRMQSSDF